MTTYTVLKYPHGLLRRKATVVEKFTPSLQKFSEGMIATMRAREGIGLAAPQVGILKRVIVVDIEPYLNIESVAEWHGSGIMWKGGQELPIKYPLVIVNPEVVKFDAEVVFPYDGCLSFPGASGYPSNRFRRCEVKGKDLLGAEIRIEAEGILSVCLQHEIDHLNGVLFVDRLVDDSSVGDIEQDVRAIEDESSYRKMLKKLHPVDARNEAWDFL